MFMHLGLFNVHRYQNDFCDIIIGFNSSLCEKFNPDTQVLYISGKHVRKMYTPLNPTFI